MNYDIENLDAMEYDELEELRDNLLDALDYYPEDSEKHNDLYFDLEEVYHELKRRDEVEKTLDDNVIDEEYACDTADEMMILLANKLAKIGKELDDYNLVSLTDKIANILEGISVTDKSTVS